MRKTLKTIVTIVLSAAMLAGLSACGSSAPDSSTGSKGSVKKITVSLDWMPNTNHTGMYAAQALGYYKEAGLEVEIVQPPEDGAVSMCAAGQAQFAIDAQDTTAGALDSDTPMEVTTVAALIQHNTSGIISRKGRLHVTDAATASRPNVNACVHRRVEGRPYALRHHLLAKRQDGPVNVGENELDVWMSAHVRLLWSRVDCP